MSDDKLMTSADRFSHVQHAQHDIAALRLRSTAAPPQQDDHLMLDEFESVRGGAGPSRSRSSHQGGGSIQTAQVDTRR
jgi:hypothetical protein